MLVAADTSYSQDPALIDRAVQGTLAMLEAAKQSEVTSVVLTSSTAACISPQRAEESRIEIDNGALFTIHDVVLHGLLRKSQPHTTMKLSQLLVWGSSLKSYLEPRYTRRPRPSRSDRPINGYRNTSHPLNLIRWLPASMYVIPRCM